ncbi:MAG: phosphoglucosamine mutase [Phycisphaerales bacterium]|nr:phosphoglucosamine mutase [Phycisphaerales bacterium]
MHDAPLMLSVSGARGIVGKTMTPSVATEFAAAFGSHLKAGITGRRPRVAIGLDGRDSGQDLVRAAAAGLTATGCDVIEIGVSATPTVGIMISHLNCDGGMNITASHNPMEWNGLKCLDRDGLAPPSEQAEQIIERFRSGTIDRVAGEAAGSIERVDDGAAVHVQRVLDLIDPAPIRTHGFRVLLDSINASGCIGGRQLLESYGCELLHLNGELTGVFAHTPEPTAENLGDLCSAVAADANAACGFAQDPDADRLAIVDERGRYIGEEYTLVLAVLRMFQLNGGRTVAANLSTSRMIDDIARRFDGARVIRTAVGEANVAHALREHDGLVGGEGNGGVIVPEVCWVRDSLASMALVLDLLASDSRPLSEIVDALPRYAMIKQKADLSAIGGRDAVPEVLQRTREAWPDAEVNDADGVRIDLEQGWVHVRPSNTEPIVRLIAEANDTATATAIADEAARASGLSSA